MKLLRTLALAAACTLVLGAARANATCSIYGDITATQTRTGWLYCVDFSYSILDSLDTVSIFLPECADGCRPDLISFPTPAGTLSGVDDSGAPCTVELEGHWYCDGDPNLNAEPPKPTVTWSPVNGAACHPTMPGIGHICFELNSAPAAPREQTNAITILTSNGQCWGTLKGVFPGCNPPTPVAPTSWSAVKARFAS